MKSALFVGIGGFVGALARYKAGGLVLHHFASSKFPLSTFVVNVAGCLLIGLLAGFSEKHQVFSNDLKLFLFTGLLSGFTTFSAFGYETIYLIRRGETLAAGLNVVLSVTVGLFAVWIGLKAIERLPF
jgi:CrcB protein